MPRNAPDSPDLHATALELQAQAERARRALLAALEDAAPDAALDALAQAGEALAEVETLADRHAVVELPALEDVRLGVDRLACELYRKGACDALDEAACAAFLDRHARRLTALQGVGPVTARCLFAHGIADPAQFLAQDPAFLDDLEELGPAIRAKLRALF